MSMSSWPVLGLSSLVWKISSISFLERTETCSSCFNQQGPQILDFKCKISLTPPVALLLQGRLHKAHTGNKAYAEESVVLHRAFWKPSCNSVFLSATSVTEVHLCSWHLPQYSGSVAFWSKWHFKCQAGQVSQQMVSSNKCNQSADRNIPLALNVSFKRNKYLIWEQAH